MNLVFLVNGDQFKLFGLLVLTGFGTVAFAMIAFLYGPIITTDGKVLYELAKVLKTDSFNSFSFAAKLGEIHNYHPIDQPISFYFIYLQLLKGLDLLSNGHWVEAHMVVNIVVMASTLFVTMKMATHLFDKKIFVILVWLGVVGCWEFIQWGSMTQSGPVFYLVMSLSLYFTYLGLKSDAGHLWFIVLGAAIAVLSIALRPSGIPLTIFTLSVTMGWLLHRKWSFSDQSSSALRRSSFYVFACLLVGVPLAAFVLMDPSILPDQLALKFREYHYQASIGVIIESRPETYLQPGKSYSDFLTVILVRIAAYFDFVATGYSRSHNLINLFYYIPFYLFVVLGAGLALFQLKEVSSESLNDFTIFGTSCVMLFAAFHASTLLDFDWRYRAPIHPLLVLLAVAGIRNFVYLKLRGLVRAL